MSATLAQTLLTLSTSGTAVEGTHYSNLSDITISAGNLTGTTTFTPTNNSIYDISNSATIDINTVSGGILENGTQQITISLTEDESAPTATVSFTTPSSDHAENSGGTYSATAVLTVATHEDVTVTFTGLGTATEGTDYSSFGSIVISAGSTTGTSTTVTLTDDNIYEENETIGVAIDTVSGGGASENGNQESSLDTIVENESVPAISLSVSSNSVAENTGTVTITATTSVQWPDTTEMSIDIQNPTGTGSGTDYNLSNGCCIAFPGGQSSASVTFTPVNDSYYEGNETLTFSINSISVSSGGLGGRDAVIAGGAQSETITIVDDESIGSVSLSASASSTAENGSDITITASLTTPSEENVVVNLSAAGTATSGTDYAAISSITILAGQTSGTAAFNPTNDSIYDGTSNETAIFTISSITGDAQESGTQSLTLTIIDDESTAQLLPYHQPIQEITLHFLVKVSLILQVV